MLSGTPEDLCAHLKRHITALMKYQAQLTCYSSPSQVFGQAPDHEATSKLPQHGFARTSNLEFLGKSTSESAPNATTADLSVKLDFGLSSANLDDKTKAQWPYAFGLIYSVTLDREALTTSLIVTNEGDKPFDCQVLMHTYFKVKVSTTAILESLGTRRLLTAPLQDITKVEVTGLEDSEYLDKVDSLKAKKQSAAVTITGETERIYTPAKGPSSPVVIVEGGKKVYSVVRDNLDDLVVWNPWVDKAAGMSDFGPKDGWKNMICVEAGAFKGWQTL